MIRRLPSIRVLATRGGAPVWRAALTATVLVAAGCADVAPWERNVLARPQMAPEPQPLRSALRSHVQASREAALSAARAEGGGCGCSY